MLNINDFKGIGKNTMLKDDKSRTSISSAETTV